MKTNHLIYLSSWIWYTAVRAQSCYYPNGTALPQGLYLSCPNDPVRTICCASGGDGKDGRTRDTCLENGVCQGNKITNGKNDTTYWLNFCTNKDISDPDCLDECRETRGSKGYTQITPCDNSATSKRWCCGKDSSCCTNNIGVVELPEKFVGRAVISSSTSSSPSPSPTSSTSPSSSPSPPPPQSPGLSSGAIAGIAIGVILGVLAILGALFFVRKALAWKKRSSPGPYHEMPHESQPPQHQNQQQQQQYQNQGSSKYAYMHEAPDAQISEVREARAQHLSELPAIARPVELQGSPASDKSSFGVGKR